MAGRLTAWAPPALALLACAPLLPWYARELSRGGDNVWSLVPLGTAAALLWGAGGSAFPPRRAGWAALLLVVYAAGLPLLPWPASAALAATAVTAAASAGRLGTPFHVGLWGLLLLALPVFPAWHETMSYPLRLATGVLATPPLRAAGFAVVREGTVLHWQGGELAIVEACSGVRKLWAALYLALTLASFGRLGAGATALAAGAAALAALAGNAARVSALFYLELVVGHYPRGLHDGVGLVAFALTAGLSWAAVRALARRRGPEFIQER